MTRDRTLAWVLFVVGFTAIIGQILLLRELVATLYGNELLIGLILAAWLGWGAAGAAVGARRSFVRTRLLVVGLAVTALLLPAQLLLIRDLRTLLGSTPGSMLDPGTLALAVLLIPAPLCFCLGALFSFASRLAAESGRPPGWSYVWDSAGSAAGGALFSFAFVRCLNPFQTAFLIGGLDLSTGLLLALQSRALRRTGATLASGHTDNSPSRIAVPASAIFFFIFAALAVPLGGATQKAALHLEWPISTSGAPQNLIFSGDSPYGRLAVQARGDQLSFYIDGVLAFETQGTFPEEVAHLPLLAHPAPHDVLLIGGGVAGDLREILKHPIESVTYVELDPLVIEAARRYLSSDDAAVLDDARVRLVLSDGRAFVEESNSTYDAIILDLPEPTTGALNRFYTEEFFTRVRRLLRPGGILSFGLPSAENYWSPELTRRNAGIYRTLQEVFPNVAVLPGEHSFFLASESPLQLSAAKMAERLAQRHIESRWVTAGYLEDLLQGDRFEQVQASVQSQFDARINRDMLPLSYYYSLALWLARSAGSTQTGRLFESAASLKLWWLAVPIGLAVLLARWKRDWAPAFVVAGVGLAQMLLQLVLLFAYQALHGSLYGQVSLLVTAFMAGLALGGAAGSWLAKRVGLQRPALFGALAGVALVSLLLSLLFPIASQTGEAPQWIFLPLALFGALLGGLVFPLAGSLSAGSGSHQAVAGRLYAADLAGGCLGALTGAALLIPVLGIPQTCAAIALLAVAGLLSML